jgi:hypothetical protein
MIGIPGSVNSKYVLADGDNNNDAQIESYKCGMVIDQKSTC